MDRDLFCDSMAWSEVALKLPLVALYHTQYSLTDFEALLRLRIF